MAQALGLHKAHLQDPENNVLIRRKARLFATIYVADKMLSLRLGRASLIRDEEVPHDIRMLMRGVNTAPYRLPMQWLELARIQGMVYDQLYSPRALQQTREVKKTLATALLQKVDAMMSQKCEIKVRRSSSRPHQEQLLTRSQCNRKSSIKRYVNRPGMK